jgi:tRNA nucleotidyltransferase/poly(A) polymerase
MAGKGTYLVGGYVRDCLTGRPSSDLDFAVPTDPEDLANRTARRFRGTVVELEPGLCYRVVVRRSIFIDFSRLRGRILNDLKRRDFTVNALAWSPESGLIAPQEYIDDLKHKKIRAIHTSNLTDDPIRMLRAYRFAAQIGIKIEASTRSFIRKNAGLIVYSAGERITEEMIKLICAEYYFNAISYAVFDNVLHYILGVYRRNLLSNIRHLPILENTIENLTRYPKYKRFLRTLDEFTNQNITRKGLLMLYFLIRKRPGNGFHLKLSNKNTGILNIMHHADSASQKRLSKGQVCDIFLQSQGAIPESALIMMMNKKKRDRKYMDLAIKFIRLVDNPVISGYGIAEMTGNEKKYLVGKIKRELLRERFLGNIRTKNQARRWILSNFT